MPMLSGRCFFPSCRRFHPARRCSTLLILTLLLFVPLTVVAQDEPGVITAETAEEVPFEQAQPANVLQSGGAPPPTAAQTLPTTAPEGPTMSLAVNDQTIETIVGRIREETGAEVVLHGSVPGTMLSLRLVDQSVESILNSITTPQNWTWIQRADGSYHIYDQESYVSEVLTQRVQRKVFPLRFIEAAELDGVIAPILTPEIGASSADERTNSLIVTDLPDKLALIESIIREYDVQLYSHVFEILNADTEEIADRLDQIRSEYAEIFVDPINRLIIVRDETLTKIKIMEQLVELLDRDVEIRAYNLNNIGADGGDAEEIIEKFIEPIVTQDAVVEFNLATSKLYVRDVRAVHQKIYDILRQIDVPRKQVLIEGELLSVSQSNEMNISMNWRFGNSLLDAIDTNKIDGFPGVVAGDDRNRQLAGFPYGAVSSEGISLIDMSAHVRAQLQALLSDSRTRLLLKPRLILANHEQGTIELTQNEPILTTYFSDSVNNVSRSSGQTTVRTGLILELIPAISNRGLVHMEVSFINSVPIIVDDIGNGQRGVGSSEESAETVLIIPSGTTQVIGGLIRSSERGGSSGVPFLSQIPYLGFLFGSKSRGEEYRNLMFFLTPTIIDTEPLNDLIVEPVNAAARASMFEEEGFIAPPEDVNEVPAELRPFLEQIRPEAIPYLTDGATTASMPSALEALTPGLSEQQQREAALRLLNANRSLQQLPVIEEEDVIGRGGADVIGRGQAGPAGNFGGRERPTTDAPTTPASPTVPTAPVQATAPTTGTATVPVAPPPTAQPTEPDEAEQPIETQPEPMAPDQPAVGPADAPVVPSIPQPETQL